MTSIIQNTNVSVAENTQVSQSHQAQKSSWKGFHVHTADKPAVNISNLSEEVALSVASRGADKSIKQKKDEEKKVKQSNSSSELMPGMQLYEADVFVRALEQQANKDADSTLQLVQKFFRDPTLQDAALRHAMAHIPESDPQHAEIKKAIATLHEQAGSEIRAGYNIAPAERGELSPQQARDCYRFNVLNYSSYEATFKNLLQEYDPNNLLETVSFLRKSLGLDMQALQPSCATAELHEVAEALYIVQNLGNLYTNAGKLCESSANRFASQEPHPREIMLGIFASKDNTSLTETSLKRSMPFLVSKNPSRDAVFVRGVREIARNMPTKLYISEEQRQRVLSSLQQNLDKAIEREDELEA